MKYSVCTETVFDGVDILDAMKSVKECGYDAVEFWFWWTRDVEAIANASKELDLPVAAICAPFGKPGDASTHDEYVKDLEKTFHAADQLGCDTIIIQGGWIDENIPEAIHRKNIIKLYKRIAPMAEAAGKLLVIEPLNQKVNHPTYHLASSRDAFDIVDIVGSPNLKILFDMYHQQITEGNLIANITENIDKIGHFHMAGNPGRNDIFLGEINYTNILKVIEETGYTGYAGLEYYPFGDARESLIKTRKEVLI
ncbi:hydroxypyruvate isomerase [Catenibacillus scindens]|uniref:Hydroxypyruvate isomerase n=1 Tax=Catenibacillus scindens TaxID=673271 RepID=A0A7W8M5T3_9FIRM|nr:hydroxypyruvate isomerase [Catenibacillus scindens]